MQGAFFFAYFLFGHAKGQRFLIDRRFLATRKVRHGVPNKVSRPGGRNQGLHQPSKLKIKYLYPLFWIPDRGWG
jgi:hypothetical protein